MEDNPKTSASNPYLPFSVVCAGLLVAAAVVFGQDIRSLILGSTNQSPKTAVDVFKSYAKELKLDDKKFTGCLDSNKYKAEVDQDFGDGSSLGVSGTPTFFINGKRVIGALPTSLFVEIIDKEISQDSKNPIDVSQYGTSVDLKPIAVSTDDDPQRGSAQAPVTMVEFSDYQCPFCERYFQQTYPVIEQNYINTGKVRYVLRDFPLVSIGHKNAPKAAESANCAGDQGKYWEMHDLLFKGQATWANL